MTAWQAYEKYRIMPNLRQHQMRVAALARAMASELKADADTVTRAGLLHDMGNIMKADFSQFPPEFYGEKGIEYWQEVKKDCGERYGLDEHTATSAIAKEIGASDRVIGLIEAMGFSKAETVLREGSTELQILEYADQRTAPYGITAMETRLCEGHARYKARARSDYGENDERFEKNCGFLVEIEQKLFAGLSITPESLTEESLTATIESLRDYHIV